MFGTTSGQKKDRVRIRFILDQKHEPVVLLHIKDLFGLGSISQRSDDGMERYTLGKQGYPKIVQYLSRFPLRGEKHISFKR